MHTHTNIAPRTLHFCTIKTECTHQWQQPKRPTLDQREPSISRSMLLLAIDCSPLGSIKRQSLATAGKEEEEEEEEEVSAAYCARKWEGAI